jgi:hypothetical protein
MRRDPTRAMVAVMEMISIPAGEATFSMPEHDDIQRAIVPIPNRPPVGADATTTIRRPEGTAW